MENKYVTVQEFADYFQFEQLTGDEESRKRIIELTDTNRPGLELAGFFDYSQKKRLIILGDKEIAYINTMSEAAQKRSFDFLTREETPALVITRGHECPPILRECAIEKNFPIFSCSEKTNHTIVNIISWLDEKLAKSVCVHGELLLIYGTGVLICGESGMGKSEIALELIRRGHQLVADDRVDCSRIHNRIVGFSSGTGLPTGRTTCVVSVLRCRARSRSRRCSVFRRSRTWGRCRGVVDPFPQVRPFSAAFCWRRLVSGCTGGAWSASGPVGSVTRRVAESRVGWFGPWTQV